MFQGIPLGNESLRVLALQDVSDEDFLNFASGRLDDIDPNLGNGIGQSQIFGGTGR